MTYCSGDGLWADFGGAITVELRHESYLFRKKYTKLDEEGPNNPLQRTTTNQVRCKQNGHGLIWHNAVILYRHRHTKLLGNISVNDGTLEKLFPSPGFQIFT